MKMTNSISGGQTGADRAGLDAAISEGIPHGRWRPKGLRSLDGPLDSKYLLTETPSQGYPQRTEWNVLDSDGAINFTLLSVVSGGSLKTRTLAEKHQKPFLHVNQPTVQPETVMEEFIARHSIRSLNIAGSRESKEPGLYEWVLAILKDALTIGKP